MTYKGRIKLECLSPKNNEILIGWPVSKTRKYNTPAYLIAKRAILFSGLM